MVSSAARPCLNSLLTACIFSRLACVQVVAGLPWGLNLTSQPACELLSATNGQDASRRELLPSTVLQLVDMFGNACCCSDVAITIELLLKPGAALTLMYVSRR